MVLIYSRRRPPRWSSGKLRYWNVDFEVHTYLFDVQPLRTSAMGILFPDAEEHNVRRHLSTFVLTGVLYIQLTVIGKLIVLQGSYYSLPP